MKKTEEVKKEVATSGEKFSEERRKLIIGAGVLGAAVALGNSPLAGLASAAEAPKTEAPKKASGKRGAMIEAIRGCVSAGDECLAHCLDSFKAGDTAMAECAASVTQMLAFCEAHGKLVSLDSKYVKELCQLAINICGDCEKECRKHEKHPPCKACADACNACIAECKKHIG